MGGPGNSSIFNSRNPLDFNQSVGYGIVSGYSRVTALWHNPDIDTTTVPEDGWEFGGTFNWLSAQQTLEVLSSSVNDAAAGTGARTAVISGLNSLYVPISETVTLNGITPVTTVNQYFRVNSFRISGAGSTEVNQGDITLRVAGGGSVMSLMRAWVGFARSSVYTVPAGSTLSINSILASVNRAGSTKIASFATFFRFPAGFYILPLEFSVYNTNPYRHDGQPGIILSEKTDFCIRCTYVSADNTDLTAGWLGVLRSNTSDQ